MGHIIELYGTKSQSWYFQVQIETIGFRIGCYKKETFLFQWIRSQHIGCIGYCNLAPRFEEHANTLRNLHKTQPWQKNMSLWSFGLPPLLENQRNFLGQENFFMNVSRCHQMCNMKPYFMFVVKVKDFSREFVEDWGPLCLFLCMDVSSVQSPFM